MEKRNPTGVPVIFDTDMDLDCDDAGALAVLHALMDLGEAQILGIIVDVPFKASALCAMAINHYYCRKNIPIGLVYDNNYEKGVKYQLYRTAKLKLLDSRAYYTEKVAKDFLSEEIKGQNFKQAVSLYRHILSKSKDNSVVIIAVGLLTAIANLLDSESDEFSPLNGEELIKKKVLKLVTMGMGRFPSCLAEFNWLMDWEASKRVLNNWPTKLVVQALGSQFLTGKTLSSKTPAINPVRKCYEIYLRGEKRGNYSWDPIAALYAVRGCGQHFKEGEGYKLILDQELGKNYWIPNPTGKSLHSFLEYKGPRKLLRDELESLMVKHPSNK